MLDSAREEQCIVTGSAMHIAKVINVATQNSYTYIYLNFTIPIILSRSFVAGVSFGKLQPQLWYSENFSSRQIPNDSDNGSGFLKHESRPAVVVLFF